MRNALNRSMGPTDRTSITRHRRVTSAGSALVEVCVSVTLMCWMVLAVMAAQTQAVRVLARSIEYRQAAWIASSTAESLRAGLPIDVARRDGDRYARRALRDGSVSVERVSATSATIEVSWQSVWSEHAALCKAARPRACLQLVVGAYRRDGWRGS